MGTLGRGNGDSFPQKHFESMGVSLISLKDGARAFVDLMMSSKQQTEWLVGNGESLTLRKELPQWTIQLDEHKHGYLLDHQLQGNVVVPMAQVTLWIKQGIQAWHTDFFVKNEQLHIEDVTVLQGLSFDSKDIFGQQISLIGEKISSHSYEIGICKRTLGSSSSLDETRKNGGIGIRLSGLHFRC